MTFNFAPLHYMVKTEKLIGHRQQQAIQQRRDLMKLSLQRLASEIPVYVCCRDYTEVVDSRFKSSLTRMLAW
jgi:hypothetical protein